MHILEINDFAGAHGGAERHFMSLCRLLEEKGHTITTFHSMEHCRTGGLRLVKERFAQVLASGHFDLAHIHVLDHKFLFMLGMLARKSIKIVQTLHDHRAICFNSAMYCKGKICEKCKGHKYYWATIEGCINTLMALEASFCRGLLGTSEYDRITLFISPSNFLIQNFRNWGFKGNLQELRHFLDLEEYARGNDSPADSILFLGRLSYIKGLDTLFSAMKGIPVPLKVIGTGELKEELEAMKRAWQLENVTLRGFLEGSALRKELQECRFVVVPSECYENSPYAVMEAFASGKPVVGSNLGGIAELVGHDRGLLFTPGRADELREKILLLWNDNELLARLGQASRAYAETHFSRDAYYEKLMKLFSDVLEKGRKQ